MALINSIPISNTARLVTFALKIANANRAFGILLSIACFVSPSALVLENEV